MDRKLTEKPQKNEKKNKNKCIFPQMYKNYSLKNASAFGVGTSGMWGILLDLV